MTDLSNTIFLFFLERMVWAYLETLFLLSALSFSFGESLNERKRMPLPSGLKEEF